MDWGFIFSNALGQALGPTMIVYALAAIGVNVHFGYTGLLNFGQAGFVGVGAFGLAMTVATFGFNFWIGIAVGLLSAVVLALLLGVPTLRLRADYLAIVTIATAEIVRRLYRSVTLSEWTGGSDGLRGFNQTFTELNPFEERFTLTWPGPLSFLPSLSYGRNQLWVMVVGWAIVLLCLLVVWLLMRSPWGRVLKAIREDEDAVRSLGKNVYWYKMQSLIFGGVIGAIAGFLFVLDRANAQPDTFSTDFTFYLYVIVILGGAARVFGPLVGAAIFWFLVNFVSRVLEQVDQAYEVPGGLLTTDRVGALVFVLVGLGMVLMLIFRPQGIFGDKREISLDVR
jgi:amino acid/amide ABC transporter membrane protein 2, HAAT family (TC 3.A.1.4.-)